MDSEQRTTDDERTAVAAMAMNISKPRRGQVIGERYEIRGKLRNDAFTRGFLAFDQEHEQSVLLRAIRPELLDATVREDVAARLRKVTGIGGSYLPGILDGDLDGPFVYATEPVPEGASIRDVLDRRIAAKKPLEPFELLPVVAHLDAALRALPEGARHGDVRAENVWTDTERLQLTGGFLLAAMPGGAVAAVVQRNTGLKRRFAREISIGGGMRSSDYFGVGAIVYESLVLKAPQTDGRCDAVDRELRQVLEPLLTPIPTQRSTSLADLIEVLARIAGLPIPELEPAPFHTKRAFPMEERSGDEASVHDVETAIAPPQRKMIPAKTAVDHARPPAMEEDDGFAPAPDVDEDDKTQPRASIAKIKDDGLRKRAEAAARAGAEVRAKRRALTEAERRTRAAAAGLDPRLVRAALADDEEGSHHIGAVDTRSSPSSPPPATKPISEAPKRSASVPPISVPPLAPPLSSRPPPAFARPAATANITPEPAQPDPFEEGLRMALGTDEKTSEGVPMDPSVPVGAAIEGTQEIGLDELEVHEERALSISSGQVVSADADFPESEDVPLDPSVPAKPAPGGTQEISFDELHDMERAAGGGDPAPQVLLSDLSGMKREIPPVRGVPAETAPSAPSAPKAPPPKAIPAPIAAPVIPSLTDPAPTAPPAEPPQNLPSAHAPAAHPPLMGSAAMPIQPAPIQPAPVQPSPAPLVSPEPQTPAAPSDDPYRPPAAEPPVTHAKTSPGAPKMRRKPAKTVQMKAPRKRGSDQWIIVGALLLGAMIIAGGLLYARHRRDVKLMEQQQRLQERYERSTTDP